jgi:hypothetical protein
MREMARSTRLTVTALSIGALLLAGGSLAGAATAPIVTGASGQLKATLKPSTHTPKINTNWPITVTATLKGKPARATAVYQYLFGGTVVGTAYPYSNKHYTFTGHFKDNLVFPAASVGQPLTLRVVIKSAGRTVNLNWQVTPHK